MAKSCSSFRYLTTQFVLSVAKGLALQLHKGMSSYLLQKKNCITKSSYNDYRLIKCVRVWFYLHMIYNLLHVIYDKRLIHITYVNMFELQYITTTINNIEVCYALI